LCVVPRFIIELAVAAKVGVAVVHSSLPETHPHFPVQPKDAPFFPGFPLLFPMEVGGLPSGFGHVAVHSCALNAKNFCTLFNCNAILFYVHIPHIFIIIIIS